MADIIWKYHKTICCAFFVERIVGKDWYRSLWVRPRESVLVSHASRKTVGSIDLHATNFYRQSLPMETDDAHIAE